MKATPRTELITLIWDRARIEHDYRAYIARAEDVHDKTAWEHIFSIGRISDRISRVRKNVERTT